MKLYKTLRGIIIEKETDRYLFNEPWETFVNDDNLFDKMEKLIRSASPMNISLQHILPPVGEHQELWACGVTYLNSKLGREQESREGGGADFYARVYEAARPEIFFKSMPHKIIGDNGLVRIRKDSTWNVPEPELTLVVSHSGKIVGYTIGNDMSSRNIEGENPLYLPQAKIYDGAAAIGPCILVTPQPIDNNTSIHLTIFRNANIIFNNSISLQQMKRSPEQLVEYVYRENSFPYGCLIMTGTGIVPDSNFTLSSGDVISISIDGIGELRNTVA